MATPTSSSAGKHRNNNNLSPTRTPILNSLLKSNWKKRFNTTRTPLRSAGINPTPPSSAVPPKPHFNSTPKKVLLLDWWLIKVQVEPPNVLKFGVGGNAFDGQASMYFCSGEIVKRHDEMTLETVDGITVTLEGLLNRFRTLENGFPSQVCDHFFLGFPCDWKEFGSQYFGGQSIHGAHSSQDTRMSLEDTDDPKCLLSWFDDIPVTQLFDHMMVSSGDYDESPLTRTIFDHILSKYGSPSAILNEEDTDQLVAENSLPNETGMPLHASEENNWDRRCSPDKALKDQLEDKNDNVILDGMPMGSTDNFPTNHSQSKLDEDVHKISKFVLTRSKTRSEALTKYQQEGLPWNTSTYPDTTPRTSSKQYGDAITVKNVASVSQSAIPNVENIEVGRVLCSSRSKSYTKPKHVGDDGTTRRGTILEIPTSSQDLNFLSPTSYLELTAPISASEVSGNQSRVPQMDMEVKTLDKSKSGKFRRNLNSSSAVTTRSKARSKKPRTDLKNITSEPNVTAEESAVYLMQTKKISDPFPKSEAEKSEKDASSGYVTNKCTKVNAQLLDRPGVRRSFRKRNVVAYHKP